MTTARASEIRIIINGQARQAPGGGSLLDLLVWLQIDPARVAVELNRAIVRREEWSKTRVETGATLEIVQFVGGG